MSESTVASTEATDAAEDAANTDATEVAEVVELPELVTEDISDTALEEFIREQVAAENRYFPTVSANWDRRKVMTDGAYKGPMGPAQGLLNLVAPAWLFDSDGNEKANERERWEKAIVSTMREAAAILSVDESDAGRTVTVYVGTGRSKFNPLGLFPQIITATDDPNRGNQAVTSDGRKLYRLNFRTRLAGTRDRSGNAA